MSSASTSAARLCALASLMLALAASASPVAKSEQGAEPEPLAMGPDGSLFLAGAECGPDEFLATGQLPMCEPTCANPRPICPKIFVSGVDYVPCFCKAPLVRNTRTRQCVALSECPPDARQPKTGPGILEARPQASP